MYRKLTLLICLVLLLGLFAAIIVGLDPTEPSDAASMHVGNDGGGGSAAATSGLMDSNGVPGTGMDVVAEGVIGSEGILDVLGGTINVGSVVDLGPETRIGCDDVAASFDVLDSTIDVAGYSSPSGTVYDKIQSPQ